MRAVVQRVHSAEVTIDHKEKRNIGKGLVVFLGVMEGDTEAQADFIAAKLLRLRVFEDEQEKMNLSVLDIKGDIMLIPNFTLSADCKKGNRPAFTASAPVESAKALYLRVADRLRVDSDSVETGNFGSHMDVLAANDGPVTIILDTAVIGK